jgi:hypothetical protein
MTDNDFNPAAYSGWPGVLRALANDNRYDPPNAVRQKLCACATALDGALAEVRRLNKGFELPREPSDPATHKKVRIAMWELWEDRVVGLRNDRERLRDQVRELQAGTAFTVQEKRAALQEVKDLHKLVDGLERLVKDLLQDPPNSGTMVGINAVPEHENGGGNEGR